MAKKKTEEKTVHRPADPNVMGLRGTVVEQPITRTLDENYMPYAMSVIVSRAIPEIDGFKPSHRKLLYTMYKMGLLTGGRTKSANIVGQTMRLNPHGDQAIYETMVRLAKGNESLLHPFVDSKGNFGKVYSRDMAYAASRYTEAKLAPICAELFRDLDCDAVDFVDNYDNTTKEPTLLPTTYPNVLVSANQGIAVGMASQICGFNLAEVCDTTVALLKLVFSGKLGWFDLYGLIGRNYQQLSAAGQFWDKAHHLVLPIVTLVVISVGSLMRYTRTNMLEVLNADYIRTARAKGLSERKVIYHHAFRNTLIPLVTIIGGSLPGLFSGALITETLFGIPGIGLTSYNAMVGGDIPFSMFYMTFLAILTLLGNLISDVLYAVVDPRVRIA